MTPLARTNQLLYQTELLLAIEAGGDEHAMARRMALQEAALGQLELALDAVLREVTEHTDLPYEGWRAWLQATTVNVAELERLRALASAPGSWLSVLLKHLQALHGNDGAARRDVRTGLIASAGESSLGDTLRWCYCEFKALLPSLREGSSEW